MICLTLYFSLENENRPDVALRPVSLDKGLGLLSLAFSSMDTKSGDLESIDILYDTLKEVFEKVRGANSPRVNKVLDRLTDIYDNWYLDILTRQDEVRDIDNYNDPIEDALASYAKQDIQIRQEIPEDDD